MNMMKRFVVIGGSGFVGQYVLRELKQAYPENEVVNLDIAKPKEGFGSKYCFCDITKEIDFDFSHEDIVIHLAARQYHPKPPKEKREEYFFKLNFYGTQNLTKRMEAGECKQMIYFSTDMVYGLPQDIPLKSSHIKNPFGAYGKSKLASEEFLQNLWEKGFKITIFRPRMIVGRGRFGLLTKLFWLMKHNLPIPMIGNGKNCYQMVSVEDCADAVVCAIKKNIPNHCFNLGSKNPPMVKDLLAKLASDVGSKSIIFPTWGTPIKYMLKILGCIGIELMFEEQYKIADVEYVVDISETINKLDWNPRYSDEQMLYQAYKEYMS